MHPDRLVAALAGSQGGIVTRGQILRLGVGRDAIRRRLEREVLRPIHRGVYLWGLPTATPVARCQAAMFACGEGSVLSRHAAAARWAVRPEPEGPIDVTIVGRRRVRHPAIRTHQTTAFPVGDLRTLHGIPITSPARTLLDIAADLTTHELAAAFEQAQVKRLLTPQDIETTLARSPSRPGAPLLRALIQAPAFTRSKAERMVVQLMRAAKLPRPVFNVIVEGFEVDALWRPERVILEFDSYRFHGTRAAWERDRRRDAIHDRAGYRVLRSTWTELTAEPYALVARIAEALARAGFALRSPEPAKRAVSPSGRRSRRPPGDVTS